MVLIQYNMLVGMLALLTASRAQTCPGGMLPHTKIDGCSAAGRDEINATSASECCARCNVAATEGFSCVAWTWYDSSDEEKPSVCAMESSCAKASGVVSNTSTSGIVSAAPPTSAPTKESHVPFDWSCLYETMCLEYIDIAKDGRAAWWGLALELAALMIAFIALARVCDNVLVVALETMCDIFKMSQQTAGASILALGSAAPEITVNIVVTIKAATATASDGSDPAALGTAAIIGSGYIGFLVIPAICALASSKKLQLARRPLVRDIGFYTAALLILLWISHDGLIVWYEAAILFSVYIVYIAVVFLSPLLRRQLRLARARARGGEEEVARLKRELDRAKSFVADARETADIESYSSLQLAREDDEGEDAFAELGDASGAPPSSPESPSGEADRHRPRLSTVSCLLYTVTFHANHAHNLTRSP